MGGEGLLVFVLVFLHVFAAGGCDAGTASVFMSLGQGGVFHWSQFIRGVHYGQVFTVTAVT